MQPPWRQPDEKPHKKRVRTAALHEQAAQPAAPGAAPQYGAAAAPVPQQPQQLQQLQPQRQQQQPQQDEQQLVTLTARALLASFGVSPDAAPPAPPTAPQMPPGFPAAPVPSGGLPPMPRTLTELASGLAGLMAQYGSGSSSGTVLAGSLGGGTAAALALASPAAEAAPAAQWQPFASAPSLPKQPSDLQLLLQVLAASQQGAPEAPPPPQEPAAAAQPQAALLTPQPQLRAAAPTQPLAGLTAMAPLRGMPLEQHQQRAVVEPAVGAAAAPSAAQAPLAALPQHLEALDQEVAQGMASLQQLQSDVGQHNSNHQRQIQLLYTWGSKVNTCTQQMQQAWKELVAAMQHAVGDLHKRVEQQGTLLGMLVAQQEQAQQAQQEQALREQQGGEALARAADALMKQRVQQMTAQLEEERQQRQRLEGELAELRQQVQQLLAGQAAEAAAAAAAAAEPDPGSPPAQPGPRPSATV